MPIAPAAPAAKPTSEIDRLRAELAAANAKLAKKNKVTFKVSEKGAVSVYGLGRFPLTEFQRKLASVQWRAESLRFLVPIADLRDAARKARGLVTILPGDLRSGPMPLARLTAPDVNDFPRILPPLDSIRSGWTSRLIHTGRVDPSALADED